MILEIDGITFSYGSSEKTIEDIGICVGPGESVSILGPNGVGKTTFLKCLNGICRPETGTVYVDGDDILSMSSREAAKRMGYVPQNSETTVARVFDSVLLGRKPHISYSVTDSDVRLTGRVIDLLGLSQISEKRMNEISGGERQMVNIARAIVQHPRVLLLDEPTSNLDPKNQHRIMRMLTGIVRDNGMCAVMTNHDINLSLRYCDKFIMMKEGRVFSAGGPETVTEESILEVYGLEVTVETIRGKPVMVPI